MINMIREYDESIYDLLNDMDQDVEQYAQEKASKEDVAGWKSAFTKRNNKKGKVYRFKASKYIAAAIIFFALGGILFSRPAMAGINLLAYHIQELAGGNTDLSSYSYAVDKTISKYGINVAVGDVIVDDDCIYVSYTVNDENEYTDDEWPLGQSVDANIYVNGILAFNGSRGGMKELDGQNYIYMMEYEVKNIDMEAEKEYRLDFYGFDDDKIKKLGDISFIASGDELSKATTKVSIDHEITLSNGLVVSLKDYVANPVQQKITMEYKGEAINSDSYDMVLRGVDNLGRKMMFYIASTNGEDGKMVLFYENNQTMLDNGFDMNEVTSFTVCAFEQKMPEESGKIDSEEVQIGEEFVINIK